MPSPDQRGPRAASTTSRDAAAASRPISGDGAARRRSGRTARAAVLATGAVVVPALLVPSAGAASTAVRRVDHIAGVQRAADRTAVEPSSSPAAARAVPSGTPSGARRSLRAARPDWASSGAALGRVDRSQTVPVRLTLAWRDPDGLAALNRDVSDPASSSYGKYLTPSAFRDRFAPTAATVQKVAAALRARGLTVDGVSRNGSRLTAHGTAPEVERAFGTALNAYRVKGKVLRAAAGTPTLPADIAPAVAAVQGLDQSGAFTKPGATPAPVFRNAGPCSTYWGEKLSTGTPDAFGGPVPVVPCGYTSKQLRSAYGLQTGQDGGGSSVAIIDAYASPTIEKDANTWSANQSVPAFAKGQLDQSLTPYWITQIPETPGDGGDDPQGWYGEQTLDVEAVHAMAPGAKVVYAGARDPYDASLDDTLSDVIESGKAQIVSNSYGETEGDTSEASRAAFETIAQEATATGVGLYFSSGDNGDEVVNTGVRQADFPSGSPSVTAVGGTSVGIGADGQWLFETPWGTDKSNLNAAGTGWEPAPGDPSGYTSGGGGGTSAFAAQPAYQAPVVPPALATKYPGATSAHRVVPDVSAIGDPNTGFLMGQTQTSPDGSVAYSEYRIGGTSLASPVTAGIMAVVDQGRAAKGLPRTGFANPALYAAPASAFHDQADGSRATRGVVRTDFVNAADATDGLAVSLRAIGDTGTLSSIPGYDDSTGRGSPNGTAFYEALTK
ncbi:S53 family peptidase [Patulibacter minatonensis]|uniref:S53 family peptidase n=1 Tax=Patulibacter minatonensis TaxID=298163 RepID=UPI0012FAAEEC|nr:S53 family peptidase [Patulibacter minatonensis]